MALQWDYLTKFILVGDSSVGKSSILIRLTEQRWLSATDPTVGVEFGSHTVVLASGERVRANVWDTAGSEAFRSITQSYYRGAAGALIVYNVTSRPSFEHVASWLRDVRALAEEDVTVLLVGNMSDLADEGDGGRRAVATEEGKRLAEEEGLLFIETSARTGSNIESAFLLAAEAIHAKFVASGAGAPCAPGAMPDASGAGLMKRGGRSAVLKVTQEEEEGAGAGSGCCTIA